MAAKGRFDAEADLEYEQKIREQVFGGQIEGPAHLSAHSEMINIGLILSGNYKRLHK